MSMTDHGENAAIAVNIIGNLERQGYSPRRKQDILWLMQAMVDAEFLRDPKDGEHGSRA